MGALDRVFRSRRPSQERPLAAIIAGLWRNGEQGVWYDVEGFRDSWNSVGTNFLVNGGFDTAAGWVVGTGWTISGGVATFNNTSGATQSITRGAPSATGKWYLIEFDLGISNGSVDVAYGGSSAVHFSASGRCRFLHYRTNNYGLYFYALNGAVGSIDNITIKEWFGLSSCALYQDATGALPVYMPGQGQVDPPVGLLLDKRKGLVRGPELLVNEDFSAGATSWGVSGADATHIATFSNGALRYQSDTTSPVLNISQVGVPIVAGKWYEVTVAVSSWTSGGLKTDTLNGNSAAGLTLTQGPGTYRVIGLATATTSSFGFSRNSTNVDLTIDSISVRELLGNHAYQTTTTSRPTLSGRYNQFLASEKFDDPYWTWQASFAIQKTSEVADPFGGFDGWKITSTVANAALSRAVLTGFRNPVFTLVCKPGLWKPSVLLRNVTTATNLLQGAFDQADYTGANGKFSTKDLGGGWKELRIEITSGVAVTDSLVAYLGSTGAIPVGQYMYLLRADFRESGDGAGLPPYQRVVDANTYDTAGFPLYLKFDGVDDWIQTESVDFGNTFSVLVSAAARKLTDASTGLVVELGTNFSTTAGTFAMFYPANSGFPLASFSSRGANAAATALDNAAVAPLTAVLTGLANTVEPRCALRKNGVVVATSASVQGGGFFGKYPLYIGRRGGTSVTFNGRLYSLLIRGAATPDATITKVERYLNSKARIY